MVFTWATELGDDDPPVYGSFNEETAAWQLEDAHLSAFLTKVVLIEGIFGTPHGASAAWISQKTFETISRIVPPIGSGVWRWPSDPATVHAHAGAFMLAAPNGVIQGRQGYSVFLGAKKPEPLAFLREIVDQHWEHVAIGE